MAIAIDTSSAAVTGNNPSWSHTCNSASALYIEGIGSADYTTVTYNGSPLTKVKTATSSNTGTHVQLWGILNPATGTHTLAVTGNSGRAQSVSYTGTSTSSLADATASVIDQSNTGAGNNTTPLTVVASGCWVLGTSEDQTVNPDTGVIIIQVRSGGSLGNGYVNDSNGTVATGSINVGYHYTASNIVTIVAISIPPAVTTTVYTLSPTTGSYAITGFNIGLSYVRTMVATTANFIMTGFDIMMSWTRTWTDQTKNSSSYSDQSKNTSSYSDQTKSSTSWTDQSKH